MPVSNIGDHRLYKMHLLQKHSSQNFDLILLLFIFSKNFCSCIIYSCLIPSPPALFRIVLSFINTTFFLASFYNSYHFHAPIILELLLNFELLPSSFSILNLKIDLNFFHPIFTLIWPKCLHLTLAQLIIILFVLTLRLSQLFLELRLIIAVLV